MNIPKLIEKLTFEYVKFLKMHRFLETKSVALYGRATSAGQMKRDAARIGTP